MFFALTFLYDKTDDDSEAPSHSSPATDLSSASYVQVRFSLIFAFKASLTNRPIFIIWISVSGRRAEANTWSLSITIEIGRRAVGRAADDTSDRGRNGRAAGGGGGALPRPQGALATATRRKRRRPRRSVWPWPYSREKHRMRRMEEAGRRRRRQGDSVRSGRAGARGAVPTGKGCGIERRSQLGSGGSGHPRRAPSASAGRPGRRPAGRATRAIADPLHPARARRPQGRKVRRLRASDRRRVAIIMKNMFSKRCTLSTSVWAASGAIQAVADEVLTPTLALSFNALARPPLVLATHFALALRDAMRPLWLAFADALEPLARVLTGFRLVHVERACHRPQLHHV
ncbi:uncharacterized protein LOC125049344 isoform X1 [Pieris napi]|uniref:uncharacterized protein LOC125049344 isoform X1 n=1 Tax=Pieris napi TaxID=78633 RepID=UPI001FBAC6CD|nr:uncharacterized protein LOC125049344 isoform X1 [Pieris napi]